MDNKDICNWYIKTYHPNFYCRKKFDFYPFTIEGKIKIAKIKAKEAYRIFDRMMMWYAQEEGYTYWLGESLKLTYICFIVNKNDEAYDYLKDLLDRANNCAHDKKVDKVIKQIKKVIF